MSTIGDTIRTRRQAAGLTQQQLADELGVAQPHVSRWERGWRMPRAATEVRILAAIERLSEERNR